jgi:hypothetical protein
LHKDELIAVDDDMRTVARFQADFEVAREISSARNRYLALAVDFRTLIRIGNAV